VTVLSFNVLWNGTAAQRGMQALGLNTEKTARAFHALKVGAGIALVAAAGAAIKFGADSVRAYSDAQTQQDKLAFAFQKFPKLADTNQAALQRLNTELAKKTRFDDDATASGQAVLAQFGLTGQQLTKLTPLLQDYAAKTGKDLPAAAGVLGKAFLGNTRALKAIGIDYHMTGNKAVDFANIQRLVNEKVGGFAEKEGKSAAGQAAILRNQFGELQEAAGSKLLPALTKVVGGLIKLVGLVQDNSAIFSTFGKVVKTVFGAFAEAAGLGKGSFKDFSNFIATHQADITGGLIKGGKVALEFASGLATLASVGLKSFAFLMHGQARMVEFAVSGFGLLLKAEAAAFGWIPGIGPKIKAASAAFSSFTTGMVSGMHGAADAATTAADGIDHKLKPAIVAAQGKLDKLGKTELADARNRDIMARAEINHRNTLDAATAAASRNGKTLDSNTQKGRDNRTALNNLVASSRDYIAKLVATQASSKRVTAATADARAEFVRTAIKMGASREEARKLAIKYYDVRDAVKSIKSRNVSVDIHFTANSKSVASAMAANVKSYAVMIRKNAGGYTGGVIGFGSQGMHIRRATGGVMPGYTPGQDVHSFYSPTAGQLDLSGGEAVMRPEWTRAVGGPKAVERINAAARAGRFGREPGGFASGGTISFADINAATASTVVLARAWGSAMRSVVASTMTTMTKNAMAAVAASAATGLAPGVGGGRGLVSYHGGTFSGLFAANLRRAEQAAGHNFIILQGGWKGHGGGARVAASGTSHDGDAVDARQDGSLLRAFRRYVGAMWFRNWTGNYHMHGIPAPGRGYGSASARWQYQDYLRGGNGLAGGGVASRPGLYPLAERGPERVLNPRETRMFENLVRANGRNGGGGAGNTTIIINAPNYIGSRSELKQTLVTMARSGDFDVVLARAGAR
jgi:hypothetical protein